jgi:hypothetical protein
MELTTLVHFEFRAMKIYLKGHGIYFFVKHIKDAGINVIFKISVTAIRNSRINGMGVSYPEVITMGEIIVFPLLLLYDMNGTHTQKSGSKKLNFSQDYF